MDINKIYLGDNLEVLRTFPDNSIHCCITSPSYFGLRDYGTGTWEGGDPACDHKPQFRKSVSATVGNDVKDIGKIYYRDVCKKCGAIRIDKQVGIERSPGEYVDKLVKIFREVKRVLRPDGTLWLNLGDSYAGGGRGQKYTKEGTLQNNAIKAGVVYGEPTGKLEGYKQKDLIGVPWMCAFALRADGWWLRQDIIWHKPASMPESVNDRCTKSHEYIFLLSKSQKYYFDQESIKENAKGSSIERLKRGWNGNQERDYINGPQNHLHKYFETSKKQYQPHENIKGNMDERGVTRTTAGLNFRSKEKYEKVNKRDVWTVNLQPLKDEHFAAFPQKLIEPMIKAGCPEGGLVLDPFMGSGTTGIVARKLGRNFIGIELNPKYVELANNRIKKKLGIFL